jgi:predicted phage replisome organizer
MSKNKKFFWLKLKEDFFESDEIKILESLPNGIAYSNFYLKLLCKSIKNSGVLRLRNIIPYTIEMLASMTNTNIDIARGATEKLIALNMIEVLDDGALYMLDIENMIGSETDSAQRMREARAKTINLEEKDKKSVTLCENVRKSDTEIDKEIELEKEIEIDKEKKIKKEKSTVKAKAFTIPTILEIKEYCEERKNNVDAEKFFDYYESKGWLVGKTKMKNWQAAIRNWEKNSFDNGNKKQELKTHNHNEFANFEEYDFLAEFDEILKEEEANKCLNK